MLELRKDYVLDRWVIVSTERAKRPQDFKVEEEKESKEKICYFCPGNEDKTPPEIGRIEKDGKWEMRWFANKFAAVKEEGQAEIKTDNKYYTFSSSYGRHEIIVETNDKTQMWDFSAEKLRQLLGVYVKRILELENVEGIEYVVVFKNHGKGGGASLKHSHTQVMAINHIPQEIRLKLDAVKIFDKCPYCDVVGNESKSDRRCYENSEFAAFAPYASRFNYEIWILPKKHLRRFEELDLEMLSEILRRVLERLKEMGWDYNIVFHYAPSGEDLHFQINVCPRISNWAGFEISSGEIINIVSPEDAAKFYRG